MNSPLIDWPSEAGQFYNSDFKPSASFDEIMATGFPPFPPIPQAPTPSPTMQQAAAPTSGPFNDIRTSCQAAQSRIMRLQQVTNNQVGLTSMIREAWFTELRGIAQCFVTAQQASAKLEQIVNTDRAQLLGSLSAALNERDLRKTERDAAAQEVEFLRGRLQEAADQSNNALPSLPSKVEDMPFKVEDMPFSPKLVNGGPPDFKKQVFPQVVDHNTHVQANQPRFSGRGPRNQSKFFNKNGVAASSRPPHNYAGSSGHSTPDIFNSGPVGQRFSQTPVYNQGPFKAPPVPPVPQQFNGHANNGGNAHKRATSSFSSVDNKSVSSFSGGPSQTRPKNGTNSAPRAMVPWTKTPVMPPKDLILKRSDQDSLGQFAAGVVHARNSADEDRNRNIFQFFNSIKEWVDKYCSGDTTAAAVVALSRQNPPLWNYICSVTYPKHRSNASNHAVFLLSRKEHRSFLITRLIIQYVVQKMWAPEAWEGIDAQLTDLLVGVKSRLDLTYGYDAVLQPLERHALVEKRCNAIHEFMGNRDWQNKYKLQKVNCDLNRIKEIVGPLMDNGKVNLDSPHRELFSICENGIRLSSVLNTCRLSFQFIFNECGIKFSDQSHRPMNSNMSARDLQAHHWRIACVVTPGITYRNDAGASVDPRFLAKANVLVMQ